MQEARALDLKRALMNQHDRTTAMQVQLTSWALPLLSVQHVLHWHRASVLFQASDMPQHLRS